MVDQFPLFKYVNFADLPESGFVPVRGVILRGRTVFPLKGRAFASAWPKDTRLG